MAEKKVRIRKALTVREQTELARSKFETNRELPKLPGDKNIRSRLTIDRNIVRLLAFIVRPLRPVLRPLRWIIPTYFINAWHEVKQVSWPNRRETWRLTLAVFVFAVVFGLLIAGVDKVLDELFKKVILKQ